MQRVRIGITGLACVLLVVLFAAAIVGFQTRDAARSDNLAATNNEMVEAPKDPLAELGVAPGGASSGDKPPSVPAPTR
jgi:hypothetical protein